MLCFTPLEGMVLAALKLFRLGVNSYTYACWVGTRQAFLLKCLRSK
jgi:hypothetical protein